MYADSITCCTLVSHVEYAPNALLRLKKTGQTDGLTSDVFTLRLLLHAASVIMTLTKPKQQLVLGYRIFR